MRETTSNDCTTRCVIYLGGKPAEERVPEVAQREGKVLVEEILEELAHANVRPTAVDKEQTFEKCKLGK